VQGKLWASQEGTDAMPKVYLASPLGFSQEFKPYLEKIKARLDQLGYEVFDPWAQPFSKEIREASKIENHDERIAAFARLSRDIGSANENGIRESDVILAVLDGAELDSGTAAEIGFAVGIGKCSHGLRTDWRDSGEFGLPLNLQVLWFIERSGGRLFRSIEEIEF
jgi:nucleoside 2-deoxyribosyltransferase